MFEKLAALAPKRMGGQSRQKAQRPLGERMQNKRQTDASGYSTMPVMNQSSTAPMSAFGKMASQLPQRPPLIANKARGTMASHSYSQIPPSVSGMGQPPGGFGPSGGKGFAGGSGRMAM